MSKQPISLTGAPVYGNQVINAIIDKREAAHGSAVRAIAKYKFWMYGYHCAQWVLLNQCLKDTPWHQSNPFKLFVEGGQIERGELDDAAAHEIHRAKVLRAKWGEDMFDIDSDPGEAA